MRNLTALVMAAAYFAAGWLGESLKLAVLASRVLQAAKRFFGVPDFHYYTLADGLRVLLSRLPPRRPQSVASTSTSQLIDRIHPTSLTHL